MHWIKFKDYFHPSWHPKMQKWVESEACDKIYEFLKNESKRGKKITPLSSLTYRAFLETPLNEIKVCIAGFSPYHTAKNGVLIADGLLMGCSITGKCQPSLEQFYKGIEKEVYNGLALDRHKNPDVLYLAKQGVFMFNTSLTTELNKPGSHLDIWEPFTKYVIEECLGYTGIPIVFLGKEAAKCQKYVTPFTHSFVLKHPASASYASGEWDCEGVFRKINKIIKENNNYVIDWLEPMEEKVYQNDDIPF